MEIITIQFESQYLHFLRERERERERERKRERERERERERVNKETIFFLIIIIPRTASRLRGRTDGQTLLGTETRLTKFFMRFIKGSTAWPKQTRKVHDN